MSRRQAAVDRLRRAWQTSRQRRWDLEGGPGPLLTWALSHPWIVTIGLAAILGAVLGSTFGVPPVSPLVLVVLLIVPVAWWLRGERRLHDRWRRRDLG
jgi:Flp pilus assembly protein TadB